MQCYIWQRHYKLANGHLFIHIKSQILFYSSDLILEKKVYPSRRGTVTTVHVPSSVIYFPPVTTCVHSPRIRVHGENSQRLSSLGSY